MKIQTQQRLFVYSLYYKMFIMTSKLIKELNSSRQLMSDVSRKLNNLSEENKDLRIMLWRMIEKHGTEMKGGKIDDEIFDKILSANIYVDDDLNIRFSNVLYRFIPIE